MTAQYKVIHPVKYYRDFLNHDLRPDGREFDQHRPIVINVDSISTADGSAVVKVGNTTVVCGIKAELGVPLATAPDAGFIVPNIELTPLCSAKFRPGAPSEEAQVSGRLLDEIVANAGCLDLTELCCVRERLAWVLYCDIVCLDHDGCVVDAAVVALVAALSCLKLPTIEYDFDAHTYKVDESLKRQVTVKTTPVATSFMIFDDSIIITDPNAEEESLSNDQVTVAIVDGEICLVHKPGGAALSANQLEACLKQALDREKKVVQLLAQVLKK